MKDCRVLVFAAILMLTGSGSAAFADDLSSSAEPRPSCFAGYGLSAGTPGISGQLSFLFRVGAMAWQ